MTKIRLVLYTVETSFEFEKSKEAWQKKEKRAKLLNRVRYRII